MALGRNRGERARGRRGNRDSLLGRPGIKDQHRTRSDIRHRQGCKYVAAGAELVVSVGGVDPESGIGSDIGDFIHRQRQGLGQRRDFEKAQKSYAQRIHQRRRIEAVAGYHLPTQAQAFPADREVRFDAADCKRDRRKRARVQ